MAILLALIPISLVLLGFAIGAFVWAVRRGQFDDLQTPALDILGDDRTPTARRAARAVRPDNSGSSHGAD
jgi:cbb3-type cytochrome oxidase maturation protein